MFLTLCAFFISHLFANNSLWLPIDPINNSGYLLNPLIQKGQANQIFYDIQINGEIDIPLSTFVFGINETESPLSDSLRTRSAFQFMKGDYLYRELLLKTQSLSMKQGTITAFAHSRFYTGKYGLISEGPLLQNYLINYKNNSKNNSLSLTLAYHLENYNIPISNTGSILKMNESYLSGITYRKSTTLGQLEYLANTHISNTNIDNIKAEKWLTSNKLNFIFNKVFDVEPYLKWHKNIYKKNIYRVGIDKEFNQLKFNGNLLYSISANVEFDVQYRFNYLLIGAHRHLEDVYIDSNYQVFKNSIFFDVYPLFIKSKLAYHKIENDEKMIDAATLNLSYQSKLFRIISELFIVENKNYFLKSYVKNDAYLTFPYFEKYTPYLRVDYTYFDFNPSAEGWDYTLSALNEDAHRLNLQLGIKLKSFSISYHFNNLFNENSKLSNNYEDIDSHNYLKIHWQFKN